MTEKEQIDLAAFGHPRVLVTGVKGQLGYDVMKVLAQRGIEAVGADIEEFDLTDKAAVLRFVEGCRPDAVIHCAAYTAVDKAEDNAALCRAVNVDGTANVAAACNAVDAKLLYISTDYVFPGDGDRFYEVDDPTGPRSVYGQTKLDGEAAARAVARHFVVRISWVFGKNGANFVRTMLKLSDKPSLRVVDDQIGSPTYTADLAPLLCDMIVTDNYGTYHATNEGLCSWAQFAAEIFSLAGAATAVEAIPTSEYPASKAVRPLNSRLSKRSLDEAGFQRLPEWHDALTRYMKELAEE
ncbi:MAG: dTDP-4-dehydrorhamnose reductase [Oscillospiraceae bacterium]|nr:dTDP-4-dehydrorhamnose reductase [Oscillospiraceae bacterium]